MTRFTAVLTRGSAAALVGAAFALGASPARAKDDHGSHMSHHYYPHAERQALREHNVRHREPNRHRHDHRDNDAALGLFLGLGLGAAALGALRTCEEIDAGAGTMIHEHRTLRIRAAAHGIVW